eukprot:g3538.t1
MADKDVEEEHPFSGASSSSSSSGERKRSNEEDQGGIKLSPIKFLEKTQSSDLRSIMATPMHRFSKGYDLTRFWLNFRSLDMERKFQKDSSRERFWYAWTYTLAVYVIIMLAFLAALPRYDDTHDTKDWPVAARLAACIYILFFIVFSAFLIVYSRCKYGPLYYMRSAPLGKCWEPLLAGTTAIFMCTMAFTMGAIMESRAFKVLHDCDVKDLRSIVPPLTCPNDNTTVVEFDDIFTNWELKTAHGSSFMLATAMILTLQQLDWVYCFTVMLLMVTQQIFVHSVKAPKQDFSFYYGDAIHFEDFEDALTLAIYHLEACVFCLIMLYQISKLRRKQYSSLVALEGLRRRDRKVALAQIGKHQKTIGKLEESWRVSLDEVSFDALIAGGGSGQVWRGRLHRRHERERTVAIKKMHKSFYGHDDSADDLRLWEDDEVRFLMLLRHERLVAFYGAGESNDYRFIVCELMTGGSVEGKLWNTDPSSLTWRCKIVWALDVARGMCFIHSKNYCHRDLKTPNILYDAASGRAKVADFGLGKLVSDERSSGPVTPLQISNGNENGDDEAGKDNKNTTTTEEPIAETKNTSSTDTDDGTNRESLWVQALMTSNAGTLAWLAPETMRTLCGASQYGTAVDLYSFGVVLWEFVSHKQPWIDDPVLKGPDGKIPFGTEVIFEAVRSGKRPTITDDMKKSAPAKVLDLLTKCWQQNPQRRPSFDSVALTLERLLEQCDKREHKRRVSIRESEKRKSFGRRIRSTASRRSAGFVRLEVDSKKTTSPVMDPIDESLTG